MLSLVGADRQHAGVHGVFHGLDDVRRHRHTYQEDAGPERHRIRPAHRDACAVRLADPRTLGIWTDKYGGRIVLTVLMAITVPAIFLLRTPPLLALSPPPSPALPGPPPSPPRHALLARWFPPPARAWLSMFAPAGGPLSPPFALPSALRRPPPPPGSPPPLLPHPYPRPPPSGDKERNILSRSRLDVTAPPPGCAARRAAHAHSPPDLVVRALSLLPTTTDNLPPPADGPPPTPPSPRLTPPLPRSLLLHPSRSHRSAPLHADVRWSRCLIYD